MNLTSVQQSAARVALAKRQLDDYNQELVRNVREVRKTGVSLRKLAEASGLSHETVRKIAG